ncbi:GTPase [Streptantibioticus ferralitis]|uniref:GTPase n=1 Tax=Streptantibioticus ferralitis TaxID=236510 RepID=UPI0027E37AC4|nr:GTPase [Streptantibioticus ferralitis]
MRAAVGNSGDLLQQRVDALGELLGLSRTRVEADALADAGAVLDRAAERRRLSLSHTVVALAGATGSGKSSLFNALTGLDLAEVGVRRPTTASPLAYVWDSHGAEPLLDRLGIPHNSRFARRSLLDGVHTRLGMDGARDDAVEGLVLLDLPDHDSAAFGHRNQVDRLLELVDVVVWVLDPEKYADAVLHERYLRPMAGHADVTLVVLNQVDRLPAYAAEQVLDDLRRLLDEDGIAVGEHGEAGAVVLAASALTGEGVGEVRAVIGQLVAERGAANRRLAADVEQAAERLRPMYIGDGTAGLTDRACEAFADQLADAVGAAAVGQAAERQWSTAAGRACGLPWPRARRRGQVAQGAAGWREEPPLAARPVVAEAVRAVADAAAEGLPEPWAQAVREAARRGARGLSEALDEAAARAEEAEWERPKWWSIAAAVQRMLLVLAVTGALGLVTSASWARGVPVWIPLLVLAVGAFGGPVLTWMCRVGGRGPARRFGRCTEARLRDAAADCGRALVLEPLAAELLRYREVRERYGVVAGR